MARALRAHVDATTGIPTLLMMAQQLRAVPEP
jgi:hypothetical protein